MSPVNQGYAAEISEGADLESSIEVDVESANGQARNVNKTWRKMGTLESWFTHPDDSLHKHWYETTVRLRGIFYLFFSLAFVVALSLGITAETFFFIMASPPASGLTYGLVFAIVVTPVFLLLTAIYVDECVDMCLDSADKPSFGHFRAAVAASGRRFCKVHTDHVEVLVVVLLELLPVLIAAISFANCSSKVYWYRDVARGYFLGGLIFGISICLIYIVCHIHVGHYPESDDLMSQLYHGMSSMGRYKRAAGEVREVHVEAGSYRRRALTFLALSMLVEAAVVVMCIWFHSIYAIFIGELLAAVLFACALRISAPRLLGKAFWFTLVFFVILTTSLLLGTLKTSSSPSSLSPLVWGPMSTNFNRTDNSSDLRALPLHFQASVTSRNPKYPICQTRWGIQEGVRDSLDILDLAVLAFGSSFGDEEDVRTGLGEMLNGTLDWELLEVEDWRTTGRWIVVSIPSLRARVISVRGTTNLHDAYANLQAYACIVVLQLMGLVTPVLNLMPQGLIQRIAGGGMTRHLRKSTGDTLLKAAWRHRREARKAGQVLIVTGHSLGGALAGAVSTQLGVEGIGFSPPGLFFQKYQWNLDLSTLARAFSIVQPTNDVIPMVDKQLGLIEWVNCDEDALTCHKLTHTSCALWAQCGDRRHRDWRPTCSRWLGSQDLNLPQSGQ